MSENHQQHHHLHAAAAHSVNHELHHEKSFHDHSKHHMKIYEERGLEVIGAGFGRTGTSSLKAALEILGYQDTYHMIEMFKQTDQKFWIKVANRKEKIDFNEILKHNGCNYTATCDFPSSVYWREQLRQFPDAKVILTVRDPEKWYKSCCETIFNVMPGYPKRMWGIWFRRLFNTLSTEEFMRKVITRDSFHNDYRKESVIKDFNDHNAAVIAECPKEKLLVYEVGQGWEPLCEFLGKPIPDVPFPNVNDTKAFQNGLKVMNNTGHAIFRNWVITGLMLGAAILKQQYLAK